MPMPYHRVVIEPRVDSREESGAKSPGAARIGGRPPLCAGWVERLEGRVLMAAGFLDPSFGRGGRIVDATGTAGAVAVQSDGKIVTAGAAEAAGGGFDFLVARYNVDGSPDAGFGQNGVVRTDFAGRSDVAHAVSITPDGRIVVAGSSAREFALARYHPDGSLDAAFGGDGRVTTNFGLGGVALDLAVQADGKIVAAGSASASFGNNTFALVRYRVDGSLDETFDGDGRVTTGFGLTAAYGVAIGPGGRIVAGGTADTHLGDSALARYNPDGSLDATFGPYPEIGEDLPPPGIVRSAFEGFNEYDEIRDVAVDADSTIIAAGRVEGRGMTITRFSDDGLFYDKFEAPELPGGPGGGAARASAAMAVMVAPDRRVLAAGYTTDADGLPENFALVRYNTDGAIDRTFGFRGVAVTDFRAGAPGSSPATDPRDGAVALALAPGGAIVVAGSSGDHAAVARYLGAGDTAPAPVSVSVDNVLNLAATDVADDIRLFNWVEAVPRFAADVNGSVFLSPRGVGRAHVRALAGDDAVRVLDPAFNFPIHVEGGAGNDTVLGGGGADLLQGGEGHDRLDGAGNFDVVEGGRGNDMLFGGAGNDVLDGGIGADVVVGGDGDDRITETGLLTRENDYYLGGAGFDTVDYTGRNRRMLIKLGLYATSSGPQRERDTIRDIEGAVGGAAGDRIEGDDRSNRLEGGGGHDVLIGRGGDDTLLGGAGDDILTDTLGTNVLDGEAGIDTVNGVREPSAPVLLEAETATVVGAAVVRGNAGYTGTGYVDYGAASGEYVEFTFDNTSNAGQRTLTFRYANGGSTGRPLELKVNGAGVQLRLPFPPTGGWQSWKTVSITVQLAAGVNKIRLTSIGSSGGNLDSLTIG